jgi:DNA-directed RNA polymerase subunit N (RpoN/RPB10)
MIWRYESMSIFHLFYGNKGNLQMHHVRKGNNLFEQFLFMLVIFLYHENKGNLQVHKVNQLLFIWSSICSMETNELEVHNARMWNKFFEPFYINHMCERKMVCQHANIINAQHQWFFFLLNHLGMRKMKCQKMFI